MSIGAEAAEWTKGYSYSGLAFGISGRGWTEMGRTEQKDSPIEYYGVYTLPNPKKQ